MKYLKLFNLESDYLTYRDSKDYLKPNVSLTDDNGKVHYNYSSPFNGYDYVDLGLPMGRHSWLYSRTSWNRQAI